MERKYSELIIYLIEKLEAPVDWNAEEKLVERLPAEFSNRIDSMREATGRSDFSKEEFISYLRSYWF